MWDYSWTLSKIQVIYSATTVYTPGYSVMAHLLCPNEITPMRKYLGVVLIEQGFMRGPPESPLQLSLPTSPPAQMCCSVIWTADLYSAAHRSCGITGTFSDIITLLYFSFSVNIPGSTSVTWNLYTLTNLLNKLDVYCFKYKTFDFLSIFILKHNFTVLKVVIYCLFTY